MKSDIKVCTASDHERPVYTFGDTCPRCGDSTSNSAPAPFSPTDPHAEYRRALKQRRRE